MFKRFLHASLHLSLIGLAFLQTVLFLAQKWWFFELFTHYAHYYAILSCGIALLALQLKRFPALLLIVTFLSMQLGVLSPYLSVSKSTSSETPQLTVLASNFYYENTDFEELFSIIKKEKPDLFMIHEAGPAWTSGIEIFKELYPYVGFTDYLGVQGIVMGSTTPGTFTEIPLGTHSGLEFISEDGSYRILGVHPAAPLTPEWAAERNAQLQDLTLYMKSSSLPTLVMGDFNATPWSPHFTQMLEESALTDARIGFGFIPTWHAHQAFFKLPIDHALVSDPWEVLDFYRTQSIASDHYPIVVKLASSPKL